MTTLEYIYLAIASGILGAIITFAVIFVAVSQGIDVIANLWLLGIPVVYAILLNILFIELYSRRKKQ